MVKATQFKHHPVDIVKGLFLGGVQQDIGAIIIARANSVLTSGSTSDKKPAATMNIKTLAAAAGVTMPSNAKAAMLQVSVRDSGGAGTECYMGFAPPGDVNLANASLWQYVYVMPAADRYNSGIVFADLSDNGELTYMAEASGANTLDYIIKLLGWVVFGTRVTRSSQPAQDLKGVFRI